MNFLLTTNPGMEDIVEMEIRENFVAKVERRFSGLQGHVLIKTSKKNLSKIFKLHSIYHIIRYLGFFKIERTKNGLNTIYKELKRIEIPEIKEAKTFRVTSKRIGDHEFTSIQVQKFAGKALSDVYKKGVDLKGFDVNVVCNVIGSMCYVGVQLTKESLHKRFVRPFNHPAAIKPPLAYGMLMLSMIKSDDILLDPFCGGGTIPIEASCVWDDKIKIFASDINKKFLKGGINNSNTYGIKNIIFTLVDARNLETYKIMFDKIVTNPPYGVRIGKGKYLKYLYLRFLLSASNVLNDNGRMVIINLKASSFRSMVFRSKKFKIIHERVVEVGGLYPHIFVLEKI